MGVIKTQAWITAINDPDRIFEALILAESLRWTGTTRMKIAIIPPGLDDRQRDVLKNCFELLVPIETNVLKIMLSEQNRNDFLETLLPFLEKGIYVGTNYLALGNMDILFQDDYYNGLGDTTGKSIFSFANPLKIQQSEIPMQDPNIKEVDSIISYWTFSTDTGRLAGGKSYGDINFIEIVNMPADGSHAFTRLCELYRMKLPLAEKLIIDTAMRSFLCSRPSVTGPTTNALVALDGYPISSKRSEPIAIIGVSIRLPGASNLEEFWNILVNGENVISQLPQSRWTKEHTIGEVTEIEKNTCAGFLSCPVDKFDAGFFGISPLEASYMDPQTRMLLEVSWEALEHAGINTKKLRGTNTGVFTGSWMSDYKQFVENMEDFSLLRSYLGNSIGAMAARIGHTLGVTGPNIGTESGCSSSHVAIDLAIKSLRHGTSELAVVGAVNLILKPFSTNTASQILSPTFRSRAFSKDADGFARAEGCCVMILRRLCDALKNKDNILGILRGSAVKQEGLSGSIGTPTAECEASTMRLALADAGVSSEEVDYIEAHGTGTKVGDPLEMKAIMSTYCSSKRTLPLYVGSVKTNLGHTESCSGMVGIIKTMLAMKHNLIPQNLHLNELNPEICLESTPIIIPTTSVPWKKHSTGIPRIAGVSSFGITGSDAHIIVQEPPSYEISMTRPSCGLSLHILKLSAKTQGALVDLHNKYQDFLQKHSFMKEQLCSQTKFTNVAYTANTGRVDFQCREFVIGKDFGDTWKNMASENFFRQVQGNQATTPAICFLATGQGSQYLNMGKCLYDENPTFRRNLQFLNKVLQDEYQINIISAIYQEDTPESPNSNIMNSTLYGQLSIFCVEYCLLKLWESWGIIPNYVLGHSLGEYVAAVAAGILDVLDALRLIAVRSNLIESLPTGKMLAIFASVSKVEDIMAKESVVLEIAAVNSIEQTVVAGDNDQATRLSMICQNLGIKTSFLKSNHAFHSEHMNPILKKFGEFASTITYSPGKANVAYVSGMTGCQVDTSIINADYWVRHTREPVQFLKAINTMVEAGVSNFLEIGAQPTLSSFFVTTFPNKTLNCLPSLRKGIENLKPILTSLGKLYLSGFEIDWDGFYEPYNCQKDSDLPFYPFQQKSYWIQNSNGWNHEKRVHPLLGYEIKNATGTTIFQNDLSTNSVKYMKDHQIGSRIIFPAAGFIEMCLAATTLPTINGIVLKNCKIRVPLELLESKTSRLQTIVSLQSSRNACMADFTGNKLGFRVCVYNHKNSNERRLEKWNRHFDAYIEPGTVARNKVTLDIDKLKKTVKSIPHVSYNEIYETMHDSGYNYGITFQQIEHIWFLKEHEILAQLEIKNLKQENEYILHPVICDALIQTGILASVGIEAKRGFHLRIPVSFQKLTVFPRKLDSRIEKYFAHVWKQNDECFGNLFSEDFELIACFENLEFAETSVANFEAVLKEQTQEYPDAWEEVWKEIKSPYANSAILPDLDKIFSREQSDNILSQYYAQKDKFREILRLTNRLVYLYILRLFYQLNSAKDLFVKKEGTTALEFCNSCGVKKEYLQLLNFFFKILQSEDGTLIWEPSSEKWIPNKKLPPLESIEVEILDVRKPLQNSVAEHAARLYEYFSDHLPQLLSGEMNPLHILFPESGDQMYSAEFYYTNRPGNIAITNEFFGILHNLLSNLKSVLADKCNLRILEIGAGTGALTRGLLEILELIWGSNFQYYYTDVSHSFYTKAESFTRKYKDNMVFSIYDMEQSPLEQGIPVNYFDLVIALDVVHIASDLKNTLSKIGEILKPNGLICIKEDIVPSREVTFIFGMLEGYWKFTDTHIRQSHCCIDKKTWTDVLLHSGFVKPIVSVGYENQYGYIMAQKPTSEAVEAYLSDDERSKLFRKTWVVFVPNDEHTFLKLLNKLAAMNNVMALFNKEETMKIAMNVCSKSIKCTFVQPDVESKNLELILKDACNIFGVIYGWGISSTVSDIISLTSSFLGTMKYLLKLKRSVATFIITKGTCSVTKQENLSNPASAVLIGMAKTLKNENYSQFVRCVDLELLNETNEANTNMQADILLYELAMNHTTKNNDAKRFQVAYRQSRKYVPRFTKCISDSIIRQPRLPSGIEELEISLPSSKDIKDLKFVSAGISNNTTDKIKIAVKAYALNFKDIFTILQPSAYFEQNGTLGMDFAGIVTHVGTTENLSEQVQVGDRVFGANFLNTTFSSHLCLKPGYVLKIPKHMSYWEAATLPVAFGTAYYCLITVANLKKDDTVLIHTASGGLGLAAIQLAKHVGAQIFATAGSVRKRSYLKSVGVEHVCNSRDVSYGEYIHKVTHGNGVSVVLNTLTGENFKETSLNVCSRNARFIEVSQLSAWSEDEVKDRRPDVCYRQVNVADLSEEHWSMLLTKLRDHLCAQSVKPLPFVKFGSNMIIEAFQYLQVAKHIGKVVYNMPTIEILEGSSRRTVGPLFDSQSLYLITGGLGGIGFEVCKWMLTKGATNIVLVGRNPPNGIQKALIDDLCSQGNHILFIRADIEKFNDCKQVFCQIQALECPLRGIFHAAGVLQDGLFVNQTVETFRCAYAAKVCGTWNLHILSDNMQLEHFVLFSSIASLFGTAGQANYAAANSFVDAFAHYRRSLGLQATSVNWGQWAQVGLAKDANINALLPVSVRRMLNGLEIALSAPISQITLSEFKSFQEYKTLAPIVGEYLDSNVWRQELETKDDSSQTMLSQAEFWKHVANIGDKSKIFEFVMECMKSVVRKTLRLDMSDDLSDEATFTDVGVDSLMTIELKNSVQEMVGSKITLSTNHFKEYPTLKKLVPILAEAIADTPI